MFDLDAFDREISRQFPPETSATFSVRNAYAKIAQHNTKLGVSACFAISTATAAWAYTPAAQAPVPTVAEDMTYNGMTLNEFADFMELRATDPYVILMFQNLCAQET